MTRAKNRIQSILHAHLIAPCKGELFSKRGRAWLVALPIDEDQRRSVTRHATKLDRLGVEVADMGKVLAQQALDETQVRRLMTITGIDAKVAMSVLASTGDITRSSSPQKLVSYFGLVNAA